MAVLNHLPILRSDIPHYPHNLQVLKVHFFFSDTIFFFFSQPFFFSDTMHQWIDESSRDHHYMTSINTFFRKYVVTAPFPHVFFESPVSHITWTLFHDAIRLA